MKKKLLFTLILILVLAGIYFFKRENPKTPIYCTDCNVVLVSFDTLRQDHVSSYKYGRNTTPNIDKFVQDSFKFNDAVSVSSWTIPSTMSILTGVYPKTHKVLNKETVFPSGEIVETNLKELSPNIKTVAEILKENNYKTAGFTGGSGVKSSFGFNQGFDTYYDEMDFAGFSTTVPKAIDWIKENKEDKFFLFLHGYDVHGQFVPEDGYDKRFVDFEYKGNLTGSKEEQEKLRDEGLIKGELFLTDEDVSFLTALYDEKIQRMDDEFEKFIAEYEKLELIDKTIFILTSDHGEEFYEHGQIDHGHSLYEELIRVPLFIKIPNTKGVEIANQVTNMDIVPTIADLLGISLSENSDSTSLIPAMQGVRFEQNIFPETDYRYAIFLRAVRTPKYQKYIFNPETKIGEYYDIKKDPLEKVNLLIQGSPSDINTLMNLLDEHF